jgi:hypothetical protein
LELRGRVDDADVRADASRIETGARERVDRREIRAADVSDVAVHVSKTVSAREIHLAR